MGVLVLMFELSRSYLTPHGGSWIRAWRELPDKECLSGLSLSSSELIVLRTRESASASPTHPKEDRESPKREPQSLLVLATSR